MTLKRIAVFGGRNYPHRSRVRSALFRLLMKHGAFVVVHGACNCGDDEPDIGADWFAHEWALDQVDVGVVEEPHPARWSEHGRAAGPIRNREMATSGLDGAVEFPGGRGTASMRRECDDAGVSVWKPTAWNAVIGGEGEPF